MNFKRTSLSFAIVLVLTLLNSQPAQADVLRVLEEKVGPIPEFVIPLKAGETVSLETRNLSSGIDPVLHLWDPTNRVEIAMDDNSGGSKSARLTKRVTSTGDFLLIVRPRNFLSSGTTDIFKNGTLFKQAVQVEGWYVFLLNLQPREQINVLSPPLGAPTHLMYLISEDGLHIESRRRGSPRSLWQIPAEISGARTLLIGVRPADGGRPMRLYRNDVKLPGADPDDDGLGTELERQLQTCSLATDFSGSFPCDREHVADLRDTDGDGISDGWEVLGRQFSSDVYVALPTWGSNPRHKDMFVEADYRRLNKAENDAQISVHMKPEVARQFADSYSDKDTTDPLLRLIHATITGNPDQQPGISVHIDTGLKPELPEDAAIYGDWGGYDTIDAVLRNGSFVPQAPSELWRTHMDPSRRGIFRYGPGHIKVGGRCGTHVYCGYNFHNVGNTVHEISHTLGLDHTGAPGSGRANCKPNYPSTANYAYKDDLFGLNHVLLSKGHLPSDGRERPPLNNTALRERGAVPILSTRYINDLQTRFQYQVDPLNGNVDWNRDGVFAPAGQTVRAYANFAPGSDCEFTRMNQVTFREVATSLAITRMGPATMVFSVGPAGQVRLRQSFSSWKCPPAEKLCAGSSFRLPVTIIPFAVSTQSLDAEVVKTNGAEEVSLVAIGSDGKLRERRLSFNSADALRISEERVIPSAVPAAGEPSLAATRDGRGIYLIYKGTDNVLRWRFRNNGIWPAETIATDPNGVKLETADEASPAIASAYLPWTPNSTEALYLSYSAASRIMGIYSLNAQNRWDTTNLQSDFPMGTIGRPAMAWVPNTIAVDSVGQFYLLFRGADNSYQMMRTFFDFDPAQKRIRVGLNSHFDNVWMGGNAIDVATSSSIGVPQLWAVLAVTRNEGEDNPEPQIRFRPRADGIVDMRQSNTDDWATIGTGICPVIVNPGKTVSNPIRCAPRSH